MGIVRLFATSVGAAAAAAINGKLVLQVHNVTHSNAVATNLLAPAKVANRNISSTHQMNEKLEICLLLLPSIRCSKQSNRNEMLKAILR